MNLPGATSLATTSFAVQQEVVVEVATDVDACVGLVHGADVEPGHLGLCARQERALHRVREELLLLVEAGVVDRERGLAGDGERRGDGALVDRSVRVERHERERRELSACL